MCFDVYKHCEYVVIIGKIIFKKNSNVLGVIVDSNLTLDGTDCNRGEWIYEK